MLQRIYTNLTVGGGPRGYGLGSTPNGFSLLTGLLGLEKTTNGPGESLNRPAPDYASTSWRHPWDMATTSFVFSHHWNATIVFKSR